MGYEERRHHADQWLTRAMQTVGASLCQIAPDHIDRKEAADLLLCGLHIAFRLRRPGYARAYPFQFTLRATGPDPEVHKIMRGCADLLLYAHAHSNEAKRSFSVWHLIDLNVFRASIIDLPDAQARGLCSYRANGDGSGFYAFDLQAFPPSLVIAGTPAVPRAFPRQ